MDDSKAEQPQPRGFFGDDLNPQTAHGQFGLVAQPADGSRVVPSADESEQGGIGWLVEVSLC